MKADLREFTRELVVPTGSLVYPEYSLGGIALYPTPASEEVQIWEGVWGCTEADIYLAGQDTAVAEHVNVFALPRHGLMAARLAVIAELGISGVHCEMGRQDPVNELMKTLAMGDVRGVRWNACVSYLHLPESRRDDITFAYNRNVLDISIAWPEVVAS